MSAPTDPESLPPTKDPNRFKVGTLTYTKAGLVALMAWLLWGDVCMRIHSQAISSVLNLAFKRHGAPIWLIGLLLASIPNIINFTLNPLISTASDRTRTRWGRRIPYLAITAPITGLFMILLGFSEDMGFGIARLAHWSPEGTIVLIIALTYASFYVTDLFVGAVFWCLFNDVVPKAFLSRFNSAFMIVSYLTIACFNWFVYQYAETNMKEICVVAGLIYMFGYTLICFFIKEGKYPPPPPGMERRKGIVGMAKVYIRECFTNRFYMLFFLSNGAWAATGACSFAKVFFVRDSLGMTLNQYGKINSIGGIATAMLLYPAGVLADRFHPLRFMRFTVVVQMIWGLVALNWLFWNPSPYEALVVYIVFTVVAIPLGTMHEAASFPMYMQLLPGERFGQFCAANAMVICVVGILGGVVAGAFLDLMGWLYGHALVGPFLNQMGWVYENDNFGFRFIPVWQTFFSFIAMLTLFMLHHEWKKLGGMRHFKPPSTDDASKEQRAADELAAAVADAE